MSKAGMRNSKQRVLKRQKSALVRREVNVKQWSGPAQPDEADGFRAAKLAMATAEVETLKKRVGSR